MADLDQIPDFALKRLSTKDLDALAIGDLGKLSDIGLAEVERSLGDKSYIASQTQSAPQMMASHVRGANVMPQESPVRKLIRESIPLTTAALGTAVGATGGGALGLTTGPAAVAAVPSFTLGGATAGGVIGHTVGKNINRLLGLENESPAIRTMLGNINLPEGRNAFERAMLQTTGDIGTGFAGEMTGLGLGAGIPAAGKYAGKALGVGRDVTDAIRGTLTGTGSEYIKAAREASPVFKEYLRGNQTADTIVDKLRGSVGQVKQKRAIDYQTGLQAVKNDTGIYDDVYQSANNTFNRVLKESGVTRTADGFDFSKAGGANDEGFTENVNAIQNTLNRWRAGNQSDIVSLDILKQQVGALAKGSPRASRLATEIAKDIRGNLAVKSPAYDALESGYEKQSKFLSSVDTALDTVNKDNTQAAWTKLQQTLREGFEYRRQLLDDIKQMTGEDVAAAIAGYKMRTWHPQGGIGRLITQGGAAGGIIGTLTTGNPAILASTVALLAASSPRLQAEYLVRMGAGREGAKNIIKKISPFTAQFAKKKQTEKK